MGYGFTCEGCGDFTELHPDDEAGRLFLASVFTEKRCKECGESTRDVGQDECECGAADWSKASAHREVTAAIPLCEDCRPGADDGELDLQSVVDVLQAVLEGDADGQETSG